MDTPDTPRLVANAISVATTAPGPGAAFAKLPRVARWLVGVFAVVLGLYAVFWLAGTLANERRPLFAHEVTNFNQTSTLENSLQQQTNANLKDPSSAAYSPRTTVSATICNPSASNQFKCLLALSNGKTQISP
jgi:hypothetical protein